MVTKIEKNGVTLIRDDEKYIKKLEYLVESQTYKINEMREEYFNLIRIIQTCNDALGLTQRTFNDNSENATMLTHSDRKNGAKSLIRIVNYLADMFKQNYGAESNDTQRMLSYVQHQCFLKDGETQEKKPFYPFD